MACPGCREVLREISPRHDVLACLRASVEAGDRLRPSDSGEPPDEL